MSRSETGVVAPLHQTRSWTAENETENGINDNLETSLAAAKMYVRSSSQPSLRQSTHYQTTTVTHHGSLAFILDSGDRTAVCSRNMLTDTVPVPGVEIEAKDAEIVLKASAKVHEAAQVVLKSGSASNESLVDKSKIVESSIIDAKRGILDTAAQQSRTIQSSFLCRPLFPNQTAEEGSLFFSMDDTILISSYSSSTAWWQGCVLSKPGVIGKVPVNYLVPIELEKWKNVYEPALKLCQMDESTYEEPLPLSKVASTGDILSELTAALSDETNELVLSAQEELIQTEKDYLTDLEMIMRVFKVPLISNEILTLDQIECIFAGLDKIIYSGRKFLDQIINAKTRAEIASIFVSTDIFSHYETYCLNHPNGSSTLVQLTSCDKRFKAFLLECYQLPETKHLDLGSYLLTPVQRLCRYPILLKAIIKETENVTDKSLLNDALNRTEQALLEINQSVSKLERLEILAASFHDKVDWQNKKLLSETNVTIQNGKNRLLLLFQDSIVLAKKDWREKYHVAHDLELKMVTVQDGSEEAEFELKTEPKHWTICMPSQEEKQAWLLAFQKAGGNIESMKQTDLNSTEEQQGGKRKKASWRGVVTMMTTLPLTSNTAVQENNSEVSKLHELEGRLQKLETENQRLSIEKEKLLGQLQESRLQLELNRQDRQYATDLLNERETQALQWRQSLEAALEQHENSTKQHNIQMQQKVNENVALKQRLLASENQLQSLSVAHQELEIVYKDISDQFKSLRDHYQHQETKLSIVEKDYSALKKIVDKEEKLSETVSIYQEQLETMMRQAAESESKAQLEISTQKALIEALRNDLDQTCTALNEQKHWNEEWQKLKEKEVKLQENTKDLQLQLENTNLELEEMRSQCNESKNQLEKLKHIEKEFERTKSELENTKITLQESKNRSNSLNNQFELVQNNQIYQTETHLNNLPKVIPRSPSPVLSTRLPTPIQLSRSNSPEAPDESFLRLTFALQQAEHDQIVYQSQIQQLQRTVQEWQCHADRACVEAQRAREVLREKEEKMKLLEEELVKNQAENKLQLDSIKQELKSTLEEKEKIQNQYEQLEKDKSHSVLHLNSSTLEKESLQSQLDAALKHKESVASEVEHLRSTHANLQHLLLKTEQRLQYWKEKSHQHELEQQASCEHLFTFIAELRDALELPAMQVTETTVEAVAKSLKPVCESTLQHLRTFCNASKDLKQQCIVLEQVRQSSTEELKSAMNLIMQLEQKLDQHKKPDSYDASCQVLLFDETLLRQQLQDQYKRSLQEQQDLAAEMFAQERKVTRQLELALVEERTLQLKIQHELRQENESLQLEKEKWRKEIESLQLEKEQLQLEIMSCKKQNNEAKNQYHVVEQKIHQVQVLVSSLHEQLTVTLVAKQRAEQALTQTQSQFDHFQVCLRQLHGYFVPLASHSDHLQAHEFAPLVQYLHSLEPSNTMEQFVRQLGTTVADLLCVLAKNVAQSREQRLLLEQRLKQLSETVHQLSRRFKRRASLPDPFILVDDPVERIQGIEEALKQWTL